MKNRDYVILCLGFLAIALSYIFANKDDSIAGFLSGFGYAAVIVVMVKGILLILRNRSQSKN